MARRCRNSDSKTWTLASIGGQINRGSRINSARVIYAQSHKNVRVGAIARGKLTVSRPL